MQLTEIKERASESRTEVCAKKEQLQQALLELGRSMVEGGNSARVATIIAGLRADIQKAEDVATALELIAAEAGLESRCVRSAPETLEQLQAKRDSLAAEIAKIRSELDELNKPPFGGERFVQEKDLRSRLHYAETRFRSVTESIAERG